MRMPSIDEPPVRAWQKKKRKKNRCLGRVQGDFSNGVRRQFGGSNSEIRKQQLWTFLIKAAASTETGRVGPGLNCKHSRPFAKTHDALVKVTFFFSFGTSLFEKVQENVPLRTPEVTKRPELACIATCLLPVECKF